MTPPFCQFLIFIFLQHINQKRIIMKAFLGMGLLGSNFVKAMIKKGDQVQVWNRTASKAKELEQYGAKAFSNAEDAVRGANLVHIALRDDASVDEVLENASKGFSGGTIIIDHTTTSKEGAIERTKKWKEKGFIYQHAPVFMGPANALESSGFMLVSGDRDIISRLQPELSKMTGKLLDFGAETGKAASMKLVGNTFLVCFTAGARDTLSVAKALDVPVSDLFTLFDSWNPGAQLPARLKRMTDGDFTKPSWELNMARKDTGLFLEAAAKAGIELALIPAAAALMDQWIEKGYGSHDWSVIAKDVI
jgi:3-hydroxyisobutyrate dehydrogenase